MIFIHPDDVNRVWLSSDYHFGHFNILKYCGRPFSNIGEMNDEIIRKHNEVVKKDDMVFCLGDIAFKHGLSFIEKMNGIFFFVRGNHDDKKTRRISHKTIAFECKGKHFLCVHNPKNIIDGFDLNIVGHVHEKWQYHIKMNAFNVGVDVNNFYPVSLNDIMDYGKNIS